MSSPRRWMLPREHGAWAELLFPLGSVLLLGRPGLASALLAVATVLAFLVHEPWLVARGLRGARERRTNCDRAVRQAAVLASAASLIGGVGLWLAPTAALASAIVPVVLGLIAFYLAAAGREKTVSGELLVCVALSSASLPTAVASGISIADALWIVALWSLSLSLGTLAGRGVALQLKAPGALRSATSAAVIAAAAIIVLLDLGLVSPWLAAASAPSIVATLAIGIRPPPPAKIRVVGWSLVVTSFLTLAILAIGRALL